MSDSEEHLSPVEEGGDDDLFGDDEVENAPSDNEGAAPANPANDAASEPDEELVPIDEGDDQEPTEYREKLISEVPLYRHRIPKSFTNDGRIQSLKVPDFIKLNPIEYKAAEWEPSPWQQQNAASDKPSSEVLFRRDPKTGQTQSNTNLYRWSDGSLTIGVGDTQYEIQAKPLAPPRNKPYQEVQDAHYYAAAAHLTTNSLVIIGHFDEQYQVRASKEINDDAVERLKADLAKAKPVRGDDMIIPTTTNPELQKQQAEQAEKDRLKAQRRRENAAARMEGGVGRDGGRYKGAGTLGIGDLDSGRRGGAVGKKRGVPGGAKKKHRRPEYDSDDELPSGARRPDNYDMEDGFLVDSDEESEAPDDEEEEEDILDDDDEEEAPRSKRQKTAEAEDEDADGEADPDVDAPAHTTDSRHHRRRQIIDDDEDE